MRIVYLGLCLVTVAACSTDVKPVEAPARAQDVAAARAPTFEVPKTRLKRVTLKPNAAAFGQGMRAGELRLMSGGRWVVVKSWAKAQEDVWSAALVDAKTGEVEAVEQWVALAPDLSSGVFRAQGKLWLLDAQTGERRALDASLRQDKRSELHEGLSAFNYGRAVSYSRAGDVMSVILPGDKSAQLLRLGQETGAALDAPDGELIWRAEPSEDGGLRIWTVKQPSDFEQSAGPRRGAEGLCGTAIHHMTQDRRVQAKAWRWSQSGWSVVDDKSVGTSRAKLFADKWLWRYDEGPTFYQDASGAHGHVIEGCGSSAHALPATQGRFAFFECEGQRKYLYDFEQGRRHELPPSMIPLDHFNPRYGFDHSGAQWAAIGQLSNAQPTTMSAIGRLRLSDAKVEWLVQDALSRFGEDGQRVYDYWPDAPNQSAALTSQGFALMNLASGQVLTAPLQELGDAKHVIAIPTLGAYAVSEKPVLSQVANGCVLVHDDASPPAEDAGFGRGPWQVRCP